MLKRGLISIIAITIIAITLSGCGKIFKKPVDRYQLIPVKQSELLQDVFYIKEGTNFYRAYEADGTFGNANSTPSPSSSIIWLNEDERLVPTLYKGEVIALASKSKDVQGMPIERFKDLGFSIGSYGMQLSNGQYVFDFGHLTPMSSGKEVLASAPSSNFAIETINREKVTEEMASASGVFTCMEQGKNYEIGFYSGTYYDTASINANTHFLQSFESYSVNEINETKNGYLEIILPEDLKTGWYVIGSGLFKYIAHEKDGSPEPYVSEWNEPFYDELTDDKEYAQAYSVTFQKTTLNAKIVVSVDPATIEEESTFMALSPDGTEYTLMPNEEKTEFSVTISEAMMGKWFVYISPKTLIVKEVNVISSDIAQEATKEEQEFILTEAQQNKKFHVQYEGTGNIHGYVVAPDGQTYDFIVDAWNKTMDCTILYLPEGTYTVTLFHNTDVNVVDTQIMNGDTDGDYETITTISN